MSTCVRIQRCGFESCHARGICSYLCISQKSVLELVSIGNAEEYLISPYCPSVQLGTKKLYKGKNVSIRPVFLHLQEQLDQKLEQRQARETGICQVRRELYAQCFDELIRQCTINCVERGLLLLRVRDELRMTLHAYQTLYESSIAFGIRKALQAEQVIIRPFLRNFFQILCCSYTAEVITAPAPPRMLLRPAHLRLNLSWSIT